jgi:hypothetical protein
MKLLAKELELMHESLYRTLARLEQDGVVVRSARGLALCNQSSPYDLSHTNRAPLTRQLPNRDLFVEVVCVSK